MLVNLYSSGNNVRLTIEAAIGALVPIIKPTQSKYYYCHNSINIPTAQWPSLTWWWLRRFDGIIHTDGFERI